MQTSRARRGALDIIDSLLTQNTNGVYFSGTAGGSNTQLKVAGSQLTSLTNDAFNLFEFRHRPQCVPDRQRHAHPREPPTQ